jgi:predicted nucleic acid-binding protein
MAALPALPNTLLALDTNVFSNWRKGWRPFTANIQDYFQRFNSYPPLPSMAVFEARRGFEAQIVKRGSLDSKQELMRQHMEQLVRLCGVLPFDDQAAAIAAQLHERLPKNAPKTLVRDVFIAATALAHGYGVATGNQTDFELIGQYVPVLYLAIWK